MIRFDYKFPRGLKNTASSDAMLELLRSARDESPINRHVGREALNAGAKHAELPCLPHVVQMNCPVDRGTWCDWAAGKQLRKKMLAIL